MLLLSHSGHSGPMAKLCNAAPAFFRAQPGAAGTEFHPVHRYSSLTELTLLRGSCLVLVEIRHRRGVRNKC